MDEQRRCPRCGGDMRFSHSEYADREMERRVWRCRGCGAIEQRTMPRRQPTGGRSRKAPVDEGPPPNPVLSAEMADLLRHATESDDRS